MKYAVGILIIALTLGAISVNAGQNRRCRTGQVKGFALVDGDPRLGGIGALHGTFSNSSRWFRIRYNCTGYSVYARRIDEGVYDVKFTNNKSLVATVSAMSQQGVSSSVQYIGDSTWRIVLRGPLTSNNVLVQRELPFYIALY